MSPEIVTVAMRDGIAVLEIDAPPVNALGRPVRRALFAALRAAEEAPDVRGVVITSRRNFSAGADLGEFDSGEGLAEPTLHLTICGLLDRMTKPSVAAIRGVALGGGLELALACSARVAHPDARLGLPETTLGFMPGAGGTQRLPRAVPLERALEMIVTGRPIDAETAREAGLVHTVDLDPVAAAVGLATELAQTGHVQLRDRPIDEPLADAVIDVARRAARRSPTATEGVRSALEAVAIGAATSFDEGLANELRLFQQLAAQPEARAARYRFLSERSRGRSATEPAHPTNSAAVIGAGTMGRGITLALLNAGLPVTLIDTTAPAVRAAREAIADDLARAVARGRLGEDARDDRLAALSTATEIAAAADADLVVEAVFEDMTVKLDVFRSLDRHAKPGAVLASNTSTLDIDILAAATGRAHDVVGMHFFSPANVMRLVEVVEGTQTSASTLATALAVVKRLDKIAVVAQVGPGFIGNRIFDAYLRQANLLLAEGIAPSRIDRALEDWGMAMGPFRVLDLVGNDVPWRARRGLPADPAWSIADAVVDAGWFGRKTGLGWYDYAQQPPVPNPGVADLLPAGTAAPADEEIAARCILAMVNEAAAVLADGVAARPEDIDTVIVNGYGFPPRRGGPWFWAQSEGIDLAVHRMRRWAAQTGDPAWLPHPALLGGSTEGERVA